MKPFIRSFSLGLFIAASLLGATYYLHPTSPSIASVSEEELNMEDMVAKIENEGYHVLTNEELDSLKKQNSTNDQEKAKSSKESHVEKIYVYSLDIVPGTTTEDISKKLENAGIIEEANELEQYMAVNDYSRFIQVGQATIDSNMSLSSIAKAITSK